MELISTAKKLERLVTAARAVDGIDSPQARYAEARLLAFRDLYPGIGRIVLSGTLIRTSD